MYELRCYSLQICDFSVIWHSDQCVMYIFYLYMSLIKIMTYFIFKTDQKGALGVTQPLSGDLYICSTGSQQTPYTSELLND